MFSPLRESVTQDENIKEDLPIVKAAAETIVEPVSDQTKQKETIDMVGVWVMFVKHSFTGFLLM